MRRLRAAALAGLAARVAGPLRAAAGRRARRVGLRLGPSLVGRGVSGLGPNSRKLWLAGLSLLPF